MRDKRIIFEDKDFLIINKPANLTVHPVKACNSKFPYSDRAQDHSLKIISKEKTLVDLLLKDCPEIKNVGEKPKIRPGIVHRLDKDVSGLMIIARNQKSFDHFKREFKNQKIKKKYFALVHGRLSKAEGVITVPLTKGKEGRITLAKKIDLKKIKESWTEYRVLKRFKNFSLLKIETKTGRTHQIRIHLKSIGHQIVGDEKYKIKRQKVIPLGRVFLHAYKLGFYDLKGNWREFEIKLPEELKRFIENLT